MPTFSIPGLSVSLDCYRWGYVSGRQFGIRNEATTDYGVLYREVTGTIQRKMTIHFATADAPMERLRQLAIRAGREALPVIFTDIDGSRWMVDWPESNDFLQVLDNRREVEIPLLEQQGTVAPDAPAAAALAFTFNGQYPMKFCTADGVEVPPPTAGARIGDDDPPSSQQGGIMVVDSGVYGVTAVKVGSIVRSQAWPAALSALAGETIGFLQSIASNRTSRFYGMRHELSPAPDGIPEHAGTLPQPPVPTGITMSVSLGGPAGGSTVLPGFYEYGVMLFTAPSYPHYPGYPTGSGYDAGKVLIGPLASLTVPTPGAPNTGYGVNCTTTFPSPATMSPYFAGGWYHVARKNGGPWYRTWDGSPTSSSYYDGVLPYPGYPSWGMFGPGRFKGMYVSTAGLAGRELDVGIYYSTGLNTTGTGPWYDAVLVEFDEHGQLTGNEWRLFHLENQGRPTAVAVNRAATVAYYSRFDAVLSENIVEQTVLSTSVRSLFAIEPDHYLYTENSIRVLSNGDVLVVWQSFGNTVYVKRYSSAGVLLRTYPVTTTGQEAFLAHGADDSSFWVSYTNTNTYIDRLVNFDVATGTELHSFDSPWFVNDPDGPWNENASPFCALPGI